MSKSKQQLVDEAAYPSLVARTGDTNVQVWDATNGKVTTSTVGMPVEYVRHGRPLLQC